jgi:hypothetical protein
MRGGADALSMPVLSVLDVDITVEPPTSDVGTGSDVASTAVVPVTSDPLVVNF